MFYCVTRIFQAAGFTTDPSQATRYHGKCILQTLMTHPDFEKCIDKYLGAKQAKEMKESVQNVKTRVCFILIISFISDVCSKLEWLPSVWSNSNNRAGYLRHAIFVVVCEVSKVITI